LKWSERQDELPLLLLVSQNKTFASRIANSPATSRSQGVGTPPGAL